MVKVQVISKKRHNVKKGLSVGVEDGLTDYLRVLQAQTILLTPVRTNNLRSSIEKYRKKLFGKVFTDVEYAIYQENGTVKMSAANSGKGYFKPAVEFTRNKIVAIFGRAIRKGVRKS